MSYIIETRTGNGITRRRSNKPLLRDNENFIPRDPLPLRDMAPAFKYNQVTEAKKAISKLEDIILDDSSKCLFW